MRLRAIIGSRSKSEAHNKAIRRAVGGYLYTNNQPDIVWVSGGCFSGADYWCKYFCYKWDMKYLEAPALWSPPDDKSVSRPWAADRRNNIIVELCDDGVAFWDGKSPGTAHVIDKFAILKKECVVIDVPNPGNLTDENH